MMMMMMMMMMIMMMIIIIIIIIITTSIFNISLHQLWKFGEIILLPQITQTAETIGIQYG